MIIGGLAPTLLLRKTFYWLSRDRTRDFARRNVRSGHGHNDYNKNNTLHFSQFSRLFYNMPVFVRIPRSYYAFYYEYNTFTTYVYVHQTTYCTIFICDFVFYLHLVNNLKHVENIIFKFIRVIRKL